ncbi:MAG: hypothetical protein A2315_05605 [Ignavibacteria bacterium RIFOXYB2_FULL_35_12]|nr:MAG: hypothetical protein A2058_05265 [Ignavibacteria bacterium GWA2_36_19]OGU49944.1 MAG: hypothetical protein A2006_10895 [Ignavibacteria bacterium GWC2_35_8]OGU59372.1 MAG: hypothetical protein A2X60_11125 [Ignavibacteria bacterium GWF2_35_20]OGU82343.1 MAG: hypothetical protein A2254_03135 [Ignavibacteria bacterium RIFOXYA2_FULL_35_9]OGU86434.1 MAG: hypothetical protein A3K31_07135 [Ignavibacteria bacterium RIFOXYA12_FULL_35_25]OGU92313.1 MAG: hypothetical protein A2492_12860 [Ignavibac
MGEYSIVTEFRSDDNTLRSSCGKITEVIIRKSIKEILLFINRKQKNKIFTNFIYYLLFVAKISYNFSNFSTEISKEKSILSRQ